MKRKRRGWRCSSVVKHMFSMHEALGLVSHITREKKERESIKYNIMPLVFKINTFIMFT